jgi:hypothetical protein
MLRNFARTAAWLAAVLLVSFGAAPASAQVVQGFQIGIGGFLPQGFDGRPADDVLVTDLSAPQSQALLFDISHFKGGTIFGEWNVDVGKHLEFGAGVGFYKRTTPSIYAGLQNTNGADIPQDLRLRTIPLSAVVRFMPIGKPGHIQPYVGAGVAAVVWRYSEFGQFVDDSNNIFQAAFVGSGVAPAGLLLGGIRVPTNGDVFGFLAEIRYQWATGNLNTPDFLSNKIDLNGTTVSIAFQVRY